MGTQAQGLQRLLSLVEAQRATDGEGMKKEAKRGRKKIWDQQRPILRYARHCEKRAGHVVRRFRNAWGYLKKKNPPNLCVKRGPGKEMLLFGAALRCPTTPKVSDEAHSLSTHPIVIAKTAALPSQSFLNHGDTATT